MSVKVRVPVTPPGAAGVKVTPTVQLAPAAIPAPQVLLATANGWLAVMLVKLSVVFRRLVRVTVLAGLVVPTATIPKLSRVVERTTGALPYPLRRTLWVPALPVIVTDPEAEPTEVGVKDTWIVQDVPGARLPLQLFV